MIAGIDPGSLGAIAILTNGGELVSVIDMPAIVQKIGGTKRTRIAPQAVALFLASHMIEHVFIEKVHAMPKNGAISGFVLGHALGVVEGVTAALNIPTTLVPPQTWKKALGLPADKGNSRARAMMLWPTQAGEFTRVKDDGRAEACLIGLYGLRTMQVAAAA